MDVLFERFVSRERNEAPDIDVDSSTSVVKKSYNISTRNTGATGPALPPKRSRIAHDRRSAT